MGSGPRPVVQVEGIAEDGSQRNVEGSTRTSTWPEDVVACTTLRKEALVVAMVEAMAAVTDMGRRISAGSTGTDVASTGNA